MLREMTVLCGDNENYYAARKGERQVGSSTRKEANE